MTSLELPWLVAPNNKRPLPLYISQTKIFFPSRGVTVLQGTHSSAAPAGSFFFCQPFPLQNVALNACGVIELIRLSLFIYFTHNTQLN